MKLPGFGKFTMTDTEMCEACLAHFFETQNDIKPFNKFLEEKFLYQCFYKTKMLMGEACKNLDHYFSSSELQGLAEKKEITIC